MKIHASKRRKTQLTNKYNKQAATMASIEMIHKTQQPQRAISHNGLENIKAATMAYKISSHNGLQNLK